MLFGDCRAIANRLYSSSLLVFVSYRIINILLCVTKVSQQQNVLTSVESFAVIFSVSWVIFIISSLQDNLRTREVISSNNADDEVSDTVGHCYNVVCLSCVICPLYKKTFVWGCLEGFSSWLSESSYFACSNVRFRNRWHPNNTNNLIKIKVSPLRRRCQNKLWAFEKLIFFIEFHFGGELTPNHHV